MNEFPQGKDNYCPQCYFEDDRTVLRMDCPHNFKDNMPLEKQVDILAKFLTYKFPTKIKNGGAIETAIQILQEIPAPKNT